MRTTSACPEQPLLHLDALWIQVAGTRCNLTCRHCFVSCGPAVDTLSFLSRGRVREVVAEARGLGAREYYLTGGEPFLHPELLGIVEDVLAAGPCTVLTNGTLFTAGRIRRLATLASASRYALELRVSLDGTSAPEHDAFRGPGAFERTMDGLRRCAAAGLLPIVTLTLHHDEDPLTFAAGAAVALRAAGIPRPRLKMLPLFRIGRAADATASAAINDFVTDRLPCGGCRAVSSAGVHPCPLLVDEPGGRMGARLADALGPVRLDHTACATCWWSGATCANA